VAHLPEHGSYCILMLWVRLCHSCLQELVENERKTGGKVPKESQEELRECEAVFADF
jgi:hypothetical protein